MLLISPVYNNTIKITALVCDMMLTCTCASLYTTSRQVLTTFCRIDGNQATLPKNNLCAMAMQHIYQC